MESPISTTVGFLPDESRTSFAGTITLTKTSITAFRQPPPSRSSRRRGGGGGEENEDVDDVEEPIFIGVCSIPLIQFYRHKNMLTLLRGGSYLFDNAAASIDVGGGNGGDEARDYNSRSKRAGAGGGGGAFDDPRTWETLTVQFDSVKACDAVVDALLQRHAEEVFSPPIPTGATDYDDDESEDYYNNNNNNNNRNDNNNNNINKSKSRGGDVYDYPDEATTTASRVSRRSHSRSSRGRHHQDDHIHRRHHTSNNQYDADDNISNTYNKNKSSRGSSPGRSLSKRSGGSNSRRISPQRSRSQPSRRSPSGLVDVDDYESSRNNYNYNNNNDEDDDATQSLRSSRLPLRSGASSVVSSARPPYGLQQNHYGNQPYSNQDSRTPSRASSLNSRRSSLPERRSAAAAASVSSSARPLATNNNNNYYNSEPSSSSRRPRGTPQQQQQRQPAPALEREFKPVPSYRTGDHKRHGSKDKEEGRQRSREPAGGNSAHRRLHSAQPPSPASRRDRRDPTPANDDEINNNNNNKNKKKDTELFWRSMMKLQHHRLHFMQYLHREMAHQAFLAAESSVLGAAEAAQAAAQAAEAEKQKQQQQQNHNNNNNNNSAVAAQQLQEISRRLAEVEALHREAEGERDAAARLRRELEWKNDEYNNRLALQQQQQQQLAGGSVPPIATSQGRPTNNVGGNGSDFVASTPRGRSAYPSSQPPPPQQPRYSVNNNNNNHSTVSSPSRSANYYNNNNNNNYALAVAPQYSVNSNGNSGGALIPYNNNNNSAGMGMPLMYDFPENSQPPNEADLCVAITDRYVYGAEWGRLYPRLESDVRFNAQIDVCLALRLPRRCVTIVGLQVDQPGLRVTAEVRFDPAKSDRELVDRRVGNAPFRFLARMYEMRDIFDPPQQDDATTATTGGQHNNANNAGAIKGSQNNANGSGGSSAPPMAITNNNNNGRSSRAVTPRGGGGGHRRHSSRRPEKDRSSRPGRRHRTNDRNNSSDNDDYYDDDGDYYDDDDDYRRRGGGGGDGGRPSSPAYRHSDARLARRRRKLREEVRRQMRRYFARLEEQETYDRESIRLEEAQRRQALWKRATDELATATAAAAAASASSRGRSSRGAEDLQSRQRRAARALAEVEEQEAVARAAVGLAELKQRQALQTRLARQEELRDVALAEAARRAGLRRAEAAERQALLRAAGPMAWGVVQRQQLEERERRHRRALAEMEQGGRERLAGSIAAFVQHCYTEELENLAAAETAARAVLLSDYLSDWVGLLAAAPPGGGARRGPGGDSRGGNNRSTTRREALAQLLADTLDDEERERAAIAAEEARRRRLYALEDVTRREEIARTALELVELGEWAALTDALAADTRALLARLRAQRDAIPALVEQEAYYRSTVRADEQDEFETIAELFAQQLKELLARAAAAPAPESPSRRQRRPSIPRAAKPFHYMTFEPEDMDYNPSAVLAIEGMLGCAINKNLEVTTITSPLPKAEDESMQLQAGDMILDVSGHSLHSLSHLREVLSARAVQIREEAAAEFPDVAGTEAQTTNPALQKYIEVLCEHHNFLVQVLRGCDIYQIIVRS